MATSNLPIANATTYALRSMHEFKFKPSIVQKMYQTYGSGFDMLDIYRSIKRTGKVSNESMTAQEQGYDIRTITLGSTVTVTSADILTFTLDADDVDSGGRFYPRVGFTVLFGNTSVGFTEARLTSVSSDGGSPAEITCVASRYDSNMPSFTTLNSNSLVDIGQEVMIGAGAFGIETGQPPPTSMGLIERTHNSQIFKESIQFGGMELAKQHWVAKEGIGYFNAEINRVEFALDRQINSALTMGQANISALTQTSQSYNGGQVPVGKIKGLWTWIDELGGEVTYTSGSDFEVADFNTMAEYFESQGITNNVIIVAGGGNLLRRIEDSGITYVQGSGGLPSGDFFHGDGGMIMSGAPDTYLNVGFKGIKKAGNLFLFKSLGSFNNPFQLGIDDYMLKDAAMAFPVTTVKDGTRGMVPNFEMKYVGIDGYSRERIAGGIAGMDGFMQQHLNLPLISEIDVNNFYWNSHLLSIFMEANKAMLIKRV